MTVHVVVPTFRESHLAGPFLDSWSKITSTSLHLHVVNANPGDETSAIIRERSACAGVTEHPGHPGLYWTGLVALGLRHVAGVAREDDAFLLTNIDVRPQGDPLAAILTGIPGWQRHQTAIPVAWASGRVTSSAVVVRSWALSLNRHLGEGRQLGELPENATLPATYLPTRFLLVPVTALHEGIFPDEARLPHYCADYEYTNRLRLRGYAPVLYTGASASLDEGNTGFDTYLSRTTLRARIARARDIKCPYNFRYRFRFVRLTYPAAAFLPGLFSHFTKIFLEILFGGRTLQGLRKS